MLFQHALNHSDIANMIKTNIADFWYQNQSVITHIDSTI